MTGLVFLHGWGFGPSTWAQWQADFGPRPVCLLDAGYFGPGSFVIPHNPGGWIGIGHSLGFARLAALPVPWRGLIGLGAFLHFCPTQASPCGTPTSILAAMIARFENAPGEVLAKFHKRCGLTGPPQQSPIQEGLPRLRADLAALTTDLAALRADLTALLTVNAAPPTCPTLYVHAQDDRIAPMALAEEAHSQTPGSRLERLETGGHALHQNRHDHCAALVREFLHALG